MTTFSNEQKQQRKKEITELIYKENFELVEEFEYKNCAQQIKLKHIECGTIFSISIKNFLFVGRRCQRKECIRKRIINTNIEKFGVNNPLQNKEIQDLKKQNNIKKYGVEHHFQNKNIAEKRKQKWIEKWGVDFPIKNSSVRTKIVQSRLKNYYNNTISKFEEKYNIKPLFSLEEYNGLQKGSYPFFCLICSYSFEQRIDGTKPIPVCRKCHPLFTPERKEKMSKIATQRILNGDINYFVDFKNGYFSSIKLNREVYYRSSYELKVFSCLDKDNSVLTFQDEPFYIEYFYDGSIHRYIPDVLITYTNGIQKLVEIKPYFLLKEQQIIAKIEAGQKYCEEKGIIFEVWTEKEIEELSNSIYM